MKKQLTTEFVAVLLKVLKDDHLLNSQERQLIIEFLKKNETTGVTVNEVFNLLSVLYKLFKLFKDYLE